MRRRLPLGPAEGWLTLACVLLICLTMAWSLDDARWVLGNPRYLDLLVIAAVGGVLVGFIGPKVGWGRWLTFLIGAVFAALLVPLLVALVDFPGGASIGSSTRRPRRQRSRPTSTSPSSACRRRPSTCTTCSSSAMVVWATSMFASYAVFGHHRPLSAVVVVGVILVGNMALTSTTSFSSWCCTAWPRSSC